MQKLIKIIKIIICSNSNNKIIVSSIFRGGSIAVTVETFLIFKYPPWIYPTNQGLDAEYNETNNYPKWINISKDMDRF